MSRIFCIVGGGGGASNAANIMRRLDRDAHIDIFTDRSEIGNQPCEIPFVLKGVLSSWDDTIVFKRKFYEERGIKVHFNTAVDEIARAEKHVFAGGVAHDYDKLILDLGAIPTIPSIPDLDGYNEFTLSTNLKTAKSLQQAVSKYSEAAIIGVGQIGLELAEVLKDINYSRVYLLGWSDRVLRIYLDSDFASGIEARIRDRGIQLFLSTTINAVTTRNRRKVLLLPGSEIEADIIIFAVGSQPNVNLAKRAGLQIGESGAIALNEYLQTSDNDIYTIGDCAENWDAIWGQKRLYQTATNAARGGRIAATNAVLVNILPYKGTTLTFITECFGYQIGTVGITEEYARESGLDVQSVTIDTATRRRSFGGKTIHIKLIADLKTHALVGAQVISEELVAGKIDRLSVAIAQKMPIESLALIDTCYSPTIGTAYEPLIMALDELRMKLNKNYN